MKEYTLSVDFKTNLIYGKEITLVQNDYNSTKFNFEFDSIYDNYTKVFELKYPSGKKWIKEIIDNEVILADKDENGNLVSILIESSDYQYEIVLYDANSKLTHSATGEFYVREELVKATDKEIELDDRLPILDQLIQETTALKDGYDNLNVHVEKTDAKSTITVTKTDGTSESIEILDGQNGVDGNSAYQEWLDAGNTGTEQDFLDSLVGPQGKEGKQGPQGEPGESYDDTMILEEIKNIKAGKYPMYTVDTLENNFFLNLTEPSCIVIYTGSEKVYTLLGVYQFFYPGDTFLITNNTSTMLSIIMINQNELIFGKIRKSDRMWFGRYKLRRDTQQNTNIATELYVTNLLSTYITKHSIITSITSDTLVLNNNQEARLGELATLILTMPSTIDTHYESEFSFQSGETPTTLSYSGTPLVFVGDDVDYEGSFIPEANTTYEVSIKNLGTNGIIARVGSV